MESDHKLDLILEVLEMADLTALTQAVTDLANEVTAVSGVVDTLAAADNQAEVDGIVANLTSIAQTLTDIVAAHTPAPVEPPAEVPAP